jgi:uncharacterized coiled-coil protein SlyX
MFSTGSNNVYIGFASGGSGSESGATRIGSSNLTDTCFIYGIYDNVMPVGGSVDSVTINFDGKLGRQGSSRRYKEDIKRMDDVSKVIYQLEPVTYRYKKEIDPTQSLDFGLIAEDVAKVDPNLAIRDAGGRVDSVRYLAIQNMLLNEFLKEHRTVQEQGAIIERQQRQIDALTEGLQKVSAQLEATKPAPQVVNNP